MSSLIDAYTEANKNFNKVHRCSILVEDSLKVIEKAIKDNNGKTSTITVNLPYFKVNSTEFRTTLLRLLDTMQIPVGRCITDRSELTLDIKFIPTEELFFNVPNIVVLQELINFCGDRLHISSEGTYILSTFNQGQVVLHPGDIIIKDFRGYRVNV